ncbi:MAG TPA: outer membrane beta-barrel protein [Xanthobacteraceae bacterium]
MPRFCFALTAAASGAVLCVAAIAPACAQTAADDGDLFRLPSATTVFAPRKPDKQDLRAPRFRRVTKPGQQGDDAPTTFGQVQVYGNPPASGAGGTGFDSTNAKRRKARDAVRQKPGVSLPLRPPIGVVPDPVPATVTTRPSAQDTRRGTSVAEVPVQTLVPAIQTPTKRKVAVDTDPFAPTGIRVGAFTFFPAVELTGGFDSNPSHVQGGKDSFLFMVSPELKVRSDWERHALSADIRGSYLAYTEKFGTNADGTPSGTPNSLDRPTLDSRVDGRIDVNSRSHLDMEGRLLIGTDNPGSPNIQAGLARLPIVTTVGTTLGYTQAFNRLEVTAKGTFDRSIWQDSTLTDGTTSANDDRNFNQYGGSLRVGYELKPGLTPFVETGADTRLHDLTFDRNGEQRDSNGVYAKVGTTFEITRKLTGEVAVGQISRDYKDPTLNSIGGTTIDASLIFAATALTTFTATAKTAVNEVIVPGVSGDLSHDFALQVDHSLRRWLIATAQIGYGTDDYVGLERFDHRYFASFQLLYKLSREVQLKAQVRRDWVASSLPGFDYTADQFLLGVRLQR